MSTGPGPGSEHSGTRPDEHLGYLVADLVDGRLGDADPGLVLAHLDACPDCRAELADAVVAAAALRGVVARPGAAVAGSPADVAPPLAAEASAVAAAAVESATLSPAAGQPAPEPPTADRGRRAPALVGALALVLLLVGGVLGGVGWSHRPGRSSAGVPAAAAPLTALFRADGRTSGAAVITGSGSTRRMTIEAEAGAPPQGKLFTVWLTAAGEPTQRIGTLDSSGHGSFVMSATTAAEYSAVVLTEQPNSATRLDQAAVIATAQLT